MMEGAPEAWVYGDLEAGFKEAALVLDETFVTPDTSHQTLETRTAMVRLAEREGSRVTRARRAPRKLCSACRAGSGPDPRTSWW